MIPTLFRSCWCKDSANRTQNKIKKHFLIFFVEMQPILFKDSLFLYSQKKRAAIL